ncbi:regulatory protein RecX [Jutongia huaianensis]|uniref:Regulatory protein RecX n=1 Tax=Jutongia huaianensis TaxID=2763668 RepID=A0ABR7MYU3_9FIRM|nr:regulatory protein RecX [Jutongia huaianensis]MBC8561245.1 regulatory protein RecX [Jutongia huaianensis]
MQDELLEAKKKAMSLLKYMDRTEWQLRDKLAAKGFSEEAVEGAVDYVKSFHYLDDYRYAVHFVELHYEQRSRQRMRQDLYQRHVPEEYIDLALESICENDDIALQEALRKITKGETEYSYEEKQKIAGKLYRKGFRLGDIKRVLDM